MENTNKELNREILDTKSMLEDGFLTELNKTDIGAVAKIKNNSKNTTLTSASASASANPTILKSSNVDSEKLLLDLYATRDGLCDCFGSVDHNSHIARSLVNHINSLGGSIESLGGAVEKFNPLDHISGLKIPDLVKNAHNVLSFTKQCYQIGTIEPCGVEEDGKTIKIVFSGVESNSNYKAEGTISPKGINAWTGNEAIDYIYTPAEGKMSVKALDNTGKWIDKSDSFEIYWDLTETPIDKNEDKIIVQTTRDENIKKSKEEVIVIAENKSLENKESSYDAFPIIQNDEKK